MKAVLLLEDGTQFEGQAFGASGQRCGEVVFNTSMSGYQEILTDPSYHEQIITMTYPLIGNYGTNSEDWESRKLFAAGFVVKENCTYPSNWRSGATLDEYLKKSGVVGIAGHRHAQARPPHPHPGRHARHHLLDGNGREEAGPASSRNIRGWSAGTSSRT